MEEKIERILKDVITLVPNDFQVLVEKIDEDIHFNEKRIEGLKDFVKVMKKYRKRFPEWSG